MVVWRVQCNSRSGGITGVQDHGQGPAVVEALCDGHRGQCSPLTSCVCAWVRFLSILLPRSCVSVPVPALGACLCDPNPFFCRGAVSVPALYLVCARVCALGSALRLRHRCCSWGLIGRSPGTSKGRWRPRLQSVKVLTWLCMGRFWRFLSGCVCAGSIVCCLVVFGLAPRLCGRVRLHVCRACGPALLSGCGEALRCCLAVCAGRFWLDVCYSPFDVFVLMTPNGAWLCAVFVSEAVLVCSLLKSWLPQRASRRARRLQGRLPSR